jgi:hypothetical protein
MYCFKGHLIARMYCVVNIIVYNNFLKFIILSGAV